MIPLADYFKLLDHPFTIQTRYEGSSEIIVKIKNVRIDADGVAFEFASNEDWVKFWNYQKRFAIKLVEVVDE